MIDSLLVMNGQFIIEATNGGNNIQLPTLSIWNLKKKLEQKKSTNSSTSCRMKGTLQESHEMSLLLFL